MKRRNPKHYLALAALLAGAGILSGCESGGSGSSRNDPLPVNDEMPRPPEDDGDKPGDSPPPPADPGAPLAPADLQALALSSGSIRVSWSDRSHDEIAFVLERSGQSASAGFAPLVSLGADTVRFDDVKALAPGKTYWYRVFAENAAGVSAVSNVASAATEPPSATVPAAPSQLALTVRSASEIDLTWRDNASDEVGFRIESATAARGPYAQLSAVASATTSYRAAGLDPATTYFFRVAAYNSAGNSPYSSVASASTEAAPLSRPAAPSNLAADSITSASARLTWTDNADNETGFEIGICTGLGGVDGSGNRWCASGFSVEARVAANVTRHVMNGLTAGTAYTRYVRAYNSAGVSQNRYLAFTTEAGQQNLTLRPQYDNLAMISSQQPGLADTVYQGAELAVGCNWLYSSVTFTQDYVCAQSLLRFDLASLDGAQIESAVLRLAPEYVGVGYFPRPWHLRALATAWSPATITWNGVLTSNYYLASEQLFDAPGNTAPLQIDLTETVRNWVSGNYVNAGILLGSASYQFPYSTSLDAFAFYSSETAGAGPQLTIAYR